jgi:hypothetical protein
MSKKEILKRFIVIESRVQHLADIISDFNRKAVNAKLMDLFSEHETLVIAFRTAR